MIIEKDFSLKPFGSGTSCIDCIHGECIRDISVDECKKICENSDSCGCGIHVDFTNKSIPSYCLPLNTIEYKNNPIGTSYISTENNGTYLSRENGVDITFFRDENQFSSTDEMYDILKSTIVFNYDSVRLESSEGKIFQSFLPSMFEFLDSKISDFFMVIKGYDFSQSDIMRVHNNDVVYFFYKNTTLVLTYNFSKEDFIWENYSNENEFTTNIFYLQTQNNEKFINENGNKSKIFIYTIFQKKKYYLYVTEKSRLGLSSEKKNYFFYILKNDTEYLPNKELLQKNIDYMNHNMKKYLDKYFPDKRDYYDSLSFQSFGFTHKLILFFILFLLFLLFFIF